MSLETIGSSVYSMLPFISAAAAARMASLIASAVTSCSKTTVRSVIEPVGIGTRSAYPPSLPFNSGRTLPTATAAPVDVGMMLIAAASARRLSLCMKSRIRWSFV